MNLFRSEIYNDDLMRAIGSCNLESLTDCTIFITGGLGLICSAVVDLLAKYETVFHKGIRIIIGARDRLRFLDKYADMDCIEYFEYDALSTRQFPFSADFIIHGAGVSSPEKYTSAPVETLLSNINGIQYLFEYSRKNKIKRLLYISSSEIYGIKETVDPFVEGEYGKIDLDAIRSSYPEAKRASEMLCRAYYSEYNVDTVIVRPGHIYGPSASRTDKRVSSEFAYKAASGEKLELKSSGMQIRSYQYSIDCAVAVLTVLLKGIAGEAYNIGSESISRIRDMASLYATAGNVKIIMSEPTKEQRKAFNPMDNSSLNIEKIRQLGYHDSFSPEEGMTHTIRILQEIME